MNVQQKILKSQYIFKNFIYLDLIDLFAPKFQYKKWTSARVRLHGWAQNGAKTKYRIIGKRTKQLKL